MFVCEHTGLVYFQDVPFSGADIIRLNVAIEGLRSIGSGQFVVEPTYRIVDTVNGGSCKLTVADILALKEFYIQHQFEICNEWKGG